MRGGVKCGHDNPKVKQRCVACGGKRPQTKKASHTAALDLPYELFILLNGGEHCGICGKARGEGDKRLDRDHAHVGPIRGRPRGLLCHSCNRTLSKRMEISAAQIGLATWLRLAADYVERAEQMSGLQLEVLL